MKLDMNNKVVLVTGGSGAIGSATALKFAENGADIIIHGLSEEKGNKVVKEIEAMGRKALFLKANLSDPEDARNMSITALEKFGKVDILINNAGTNVGPEGRKPIHEFAEEDWNKIINTDLSGIFHVSKPIIKSMIERKYGKIVNVGSVAGVVPLRLQCGFVAAKAAVHELTRAMAIELAPHNIYVNAVVPGSIMFEGTRKNFYSDPARAEAILSHIPLHRAGEPEEVADTILFMASDEASYITGSILVVDGGWTSGFSRDF